MRNFLAASLFIFVLQSCTTGKKLFNAKPVYDTVNVIKPVVVTGPVKHDTDDPAIWYNKQNPSESLIIGTDKDSDGALYVYDLNGKIIEKLVVRNLQRPNNVDIAYGFKMGGKKIDIAVTAERITHQLRIFSLPEMKPIDGGGIPVFEGENQPGYRDGMGIALYTDKQENIYAIVGRKSGPVNGTYLWQYLLKENAAGKIEAQLVRKFGNYSGKKEIEAIAVDNENGAVYYSDEQFGVRKYFADPAKGDKELKTFATSGFADDHEGISIYKTGKRKGYILVSDQGANKFQIFSRKTNKLLRVVKVAAVSSDGSDIISLQLNNQFKKGLFVVMSDDKTFHYYRPEDILF